MNKSVEEIIRFISLSDPAALDFDAVDLGAVNPGTLDQIQWALMRVVFSKCFFLKPPPVQN